MKKSNNKSMKIIKIHQFNPISKISGNQKNIRSKLAERISSFTVKYSPFYFFFFYSCSFFDLVIYIYIVYVFGIQMVGFEQIIGLMEFYDTKNGIILGLI